jgi:hypothetical protein
MTHSTRGKRSALIAMMIAVPVLLPVIYLTSKPLITPHGWVKHDLAVIAKIEQLYVESRGVELQTGHIPNDSETELAVYAIADRNEQDAIIAMCEQVVQDSKIVRSLTISFVAYRAPKTIDDPLARAVEIEEGPLLRRHRIDDR